MTSTAEGSTTKLRRVKATVVRVKFSKDDYSVFSARVRTRNGGSFLMDVTAPAKVIEGQEVVVDGSVIRHPTYGQQFKGQTLVHYVPNKAEGILAFLSSGLVKGVGKKYAGLIVEAFGDETLRVIEREPHRLEGVKGIGKKRAEKIVRTVTEQRSYMRLLAHLKPLGVGNAVAMKLFKEFGHNASHIAKTTPYRATTIPGIGFRTADLLAKAVGQAFDSDDRIRAAAVYVLDEQCQIQGHTWLVLAEWVSATHKLLSNRDDYQPSLNPAVIEEKLLADPEISKTVEIESWEGQQYVAPRRLRRYEEAIAKSLYERAIHSGQATHVPVDSTVLEGLSPSQVEAAKGIVSTSTAILTGGPGTGKTTTTRTLLKIFRSAQKSDGSSWRIELAATTGKAAKKAEEATGVPAKTVHRLFGFGQREGAESGRGWLHHKGNPLPADLVVIDEASMLDTYILSVILDGIAPETRLLLIGDVDQLPSVGPGKVLRDLEQSGQVYVARLREVHRQAEGSNIIRVAHTINAGQVPQMPSEHFQKLPVAYDWANRDATFVPAEDADTIHSIITGIVTSLAEAHPVDHIQVLTPMRKGPIGVEAINKSIQGILNPQFRQASDDDLLQLGSYKAAVGDRVQQTRNDYTNMIFNGDRGIIQSIDKEEGWVDIEFEDKVVRLNVHSDLAFLELAYAQTVHKSQGSEYPIVIMPVSTSHYVMLSRENFYTGVTRAKNTLIVVGTTKAMGIAVRKVNESQRNTALPYRIAQQFNSKTDSLDGGR